MCCETVYTPGGRVDCVWQEVQERWGTFPAPCHQERHYCNTYSRCREVGRQPPCWTPCCSNPHTQDTKQMHNAVNLAELNLRRKWQKWPENNLSFSHHRKVGRAHFMVRGPRSDRAESETANQAERQMWFCEDRRCTTMMWQLFEGRGNYTWKNKSQAAKEIAHCHSKTGFRRCLFWGNWQLQCCKVSQQVKCP